MVSDNLTRRYVVDGYPIGCDHDRYELRWMRAINGALQYKHQCLVCGRRSSAIRQTLIPRNLEFPEIDPSIGAALWAQHYEQATRARAKKYEGWRERYEAHLRTPKWLAIRAKVFDRCGGICEGCRAAQAAHVHHLSYDHMGDELLFELVGLCKKCHDFAHEDPK